MAKYIDKSALVAAIERRISQLESKYKELSNLEIWITAKEIEHIINGLKVALSIVNTLEVKEVDVEKEIKEQIDTYYENCNKKLEEMGEDDNDISFLTLDGFARHFYELGLKAKGE